MAGDPDPETHDPGGSGWPVWKIAISCAVFAFSVVCLGFLGRLTSTEHWLFEVAACGIGLIIALTASALMTPKKR